MDAPAPYPVSHDHDVVAEYQRDSRALLHQIIAIDGVVLARQMLRDRPTYQISVGSNASLWCASVHPSAHVANPGQTLRVLGFVARSSDLDLEELATEAEAPALLVFGFVNQSDGRSLFAPEATEQIEAWRAGIIPGPVG